MFAGVLDGGEDEVFLGKTRLGQFMDTVENVSGAIPAPMPQATGAADTGAERSKEQRLPSKSVPDRELWAEAISAGLSLLRKLDEGMRSAPSPTASNTGRSGKSVSYVARDEVTGETYLKFPLPGPEVLQKVTDLLRAVGKFSD
jgi:hypothetical protein